LTAAETDRLVELEQAVDRGLQTFVEVGQSLAEIRDRKLYRASYDTFERYCRERWGFTRQRARQFIDAAAVTTVVVKAGLPAPANEAQASELVPLRERPDELETAWRDMLIVASVPGDLTVAATPRSCSTSSVHMTLLDLMSLSERCVPGSRAASLDGAGG
jgi:hypothetical protein